MSGPGMQKLPNVCACENRQPEGSTSLKCYYCGKLLPPKTRVAPMYGFDADGSYVSMPIEDDDDD